MQQQYEQAVQVLWHDILFMFCTTACKCHPVASGHSIKSSVACLERTEHRAHDCLAPPLTSREAENVS